MLALCSICGDIFTGTHPEVIHSTPCGHLFHYVCLVEWLQRSKTCPQCRSRVNDGKTIKLFFHISSNQATQDPGCLENELQNLKFKVSMQNLDIKKLNEETEVAKSQVEGLRKKIRQREEEIRNHETIVSALQEKIKILKTESKLLNEVQHRAASLAAKLEKYENVDKILKGSALQASEQLDLMKDKDTNTLCTCITALKKEIDQYKEKNKFLQNQLRKTEKELSSTTAEIDKLRALNLVLSRAIEQVRSPCIEKTHSSKENIISPLNKFESSILQSEPVNLDECIIAGTSRGSLEEIKSITSSDKRSLISCTNMDFDTSANVPSPRSPIKLSRSNEMRSKTLLSKTRHTPKILNTSAQCYDGFGGHFSGEITSTDRATLLREIKDRKPNKLQLPRKRLKISSKSNIRSTGILQFCSKKP